MSLLSDLRYAVRTLRRNPGFTLVASATLALGIGAITAIFTVVNAVLLKPLPYEGAERLAGVMMTLPVTGARTGAPLRVPPAFTAAEAADVAARSRTVSAVGLAGPTIMGLSGREDAARLQGARVSASALAIVGARPMLGRVFDARDEAAGAEGTIVLGYDVWQRYFGGDAAVVGSVVTLDTVLGPRRQTQHTVIGVMPPGFELPAGAGQFWLPAAAAAGAPPFRAPLLARLAEGITVEAAASELVPVIREMRKGQRGSEDAIYEVVGVQDEIVRPVRPALLVLTAAVGVVLLIACINVANLLLARTMARQRELEIRAALGAGRLRILRTLVSESVVLALLGCAAGTVFALGAVRLLRTLAGTIARFDLGTRAEFPRLADVSVDARVLAFAAATALCVGVALGLVSAMRKWSGKAGTLVVVQVALAMMLLVGGGLLLRSFVNLSRVDAGYAAANVLTFQVAVPHAQYPDARLKTFAETLVARAAALPGVQAAAYANQLPLVRLRDSAGGLWATPDAARAPTPDGPDMRLVSRTYFDTMGIRIAAGRGLREGDGSGQPRVLVVNEALARTQFQGANPLGQRVYIGRDIVPFEIVGVARDVRQFALDEPPEPQMFADMRQWGSAMPVFPVGAYYVVRTDDDPAAVTARIRALARGLEPQAALFNVARMGDLVATTMARPRMYAVLLALFAAIGLSLAVIGVYGVMAYAVTQRTREIGIRVALGAPHAQVVALVLRRSFVLTAIGIAVGLAGAAGLSRSLAGLLFGLTPLDAGTFAAVTLLFLGVALGAAFVPARRAASIDPQVALRSE